MPKRTRKSEPKRSVPYNLRASTAPGTSSMALASPMIPWTPHHPPHNMSWMDPQPQYQPPPLMTNYIPQIHSSQLPPPNSQRQLAPLPSLTQHHVQLGQPGQSTPWTDGEDRLLMEAKSKGLPWNEIHQQYFPTKTGNACRKRHERLMVKIRTTNWDDERIGRLVDQYNKPGFREEFWSFLANRLDERWDDVERMCFQQGLRGLKNARHRHSRHQSRASSGQGGGGGGGSRMSDYGGGGGRPSTSYEEDDHDDSGLGIGVTVVGGGSGHTRSHSRRSSHAGPILSRRDSRYGYS